MVSTAGHLGLVSSVVSPIVVEGTTWGVIGVSSTDDPLPLDTEDRLEKFTELVATAIANAESREAVSCSQRNRRRCAGSPRSWRPGSAGAEIYAAVAEEVAVSWLPERGAVVRYETRRHVDRDG